jgi:hypothetical protein
MEGRTVKPIPEPFPNRVAAFVEQFLAAMEWEHWDAASEFLDRAFEEAEYLSRVPPERNPFASEDD